MQRSNPAVRETKPRLSAAQLEADYRKYCKALRKLIEQGATREQIQRTVCWNRLELLHKAMPRQYRDPIVHYNMTRRAVEHDQADADASQASRAARESGEPTVA